MNFLLVVPLLAVALLGITACQEKPEPQTTPAQTSQAQPPGTDKEVSARAMSGTSALKAEGFTPQIAVGFQLKPSELEVSTSLPFRQQVELHAAVLDKLRQGLEDAQARKKLAAEKKSEPGMFDQYLAAEEDERNVLKYLAPYAIAQGKAQARKDDGFKLTKVGGEGEWKGEACNAQGQCSEVDPMVALLMMVIDAVLGEFQKDNPFGPNNELTKAFVALVQFIDRPLGGPNSDLVKIREALLFHDKNGEIAKMIRDPIKRPIEIVQDIRDKIIPKDDNGEIAKAIRDPIKCTIGHLWGGC